MGINVWFWGPPGWRVVFAIGKYVHTLVPAFRARHQEDKAREVVLWAGRTLRAFFAAAPCPYCRASCPVFVAELEAASRAPMEAHLWNGQGLRFLHDLRNKVNMKLQAQHLSQFTALRGAVSFRGKSCDVPCRMIRFETWRDRLLLQRRNFSDEDIELVLNALRLDHTPALAQHYVLFLHGLAKLTQLESRTHDSPRDAFAPMRRLSQLLLPLARLAVLQPELLAVNGGFSRVVLQVMSGMRGVALAGGEAATSTLERKLFAPYDVMRVGVVCAKETCAVQPPASATRME